MGAYIWIQPSTMPTWASRAVLVLLVQSRISFEKRRTPLRVLSTRATSVSNMSSPPFSAKPNAVLAFCDERRSFLVTDDEIERDDSRRCDDLSLWTTRLTASCFFLTSLMCSATRSMSALARCRARRSGCVSGVTARIWSSRSGYLRQRCTGLISSDARSHALVRPCDSVLASDR